MFLHNYPSWWGEMKKHLELVEIIQKIDDKYSVALFKFSDMSIYGRVRNDEIGKYLPKMKKIRIVEFNA